jgi:hypothetical protein
MLLKFLEDNKDRILNIWIDRTFQTYQPEMVRFLKGNKNPFANPVRETLINSLQSIYDGILSFKITDEFYPELEAIIKLRTVQDFTPSESLSFLFLLKTIVREEIGPTDSLAISSEEFHRFDNKVDDLIKLSFDIYTRCRKKIYEIRIAEIKAQSRRAFQVLEKQK